MSAGGAGTAPTVLGVAGAGTMGAGIAQLGCVAGITTLLHDPDRDALARGRERIERQLERGVQRGRLTAAAARDARERLVAAADLDELSSCELVIEAAPERAEIKRALFAALSQIVSPECVLATNTSSLLVTALASAASHPDRVVGMHFFNPPPVMGLVEVVAGIDSEPRALALARATGEAMGKHVIEAVDGPGFLVNRCNRPFSLEALKLLAERVATIDQIDRISRLAGGFRMGPFELMDLVGIDVGLDVARSFFEQSFGEPRWQPSPIAVKTAASGHLGRKTGRGYYIYPEVGEHRPADPAPPPAGGGDGIVVIAGESQLALELGEAAAAAGWDVLDPVSAAGRRPPFLILDLTGGEEAEAPLQGAPQAILVAAGSLAALDPGGSAVGFHALPPWDECRLVELTSGPDSAASAAAAAERFFISLGKHAEWVADAPGLVLGRIVCQVVNEAAFALGEAVGRAEDIDTGMIHGLNYPRGILAWADQIGLDHVVTVLDALFLERGEERYRVAPLLRRLSWSGRLGRSTGEGFFAYEAPR
ncbi:MAG: 3-hydroxyacyl-CoA dehydrogenase NAD-binding domain-containing protein [Solirubrobacteraceae bacterium]|jgi:3-hydroxybutyryl-CoA dehydrogenase